MDGELLALKSRIDGLQVLYMVLFGVSLALLVLRWAVAMPAFSNLAWALSLGGAVLTRLYRTSLVNKYNSLLARGRPAPLE